MTATPRIITEIMRFRYIEYQEADGPATLLRTPISFLLRMTCVRQWRRNVDMCDQPPPSHPSCSWSRRRFRYNSVPFRGSGPVPPGPMKTVALFSVANRSPIALAPTPILSSDTPLRKPPTFLKMALGTKRLASPRTSSFDIAFTVEAEDEFICLCGCDRSLSGTVVTTVPDIIELL